MTTRGRRTGRSPVPVVLDTSALVAMASRRDPAHAAMVGALGGERSGIHVPHTVLVEAAQVVMTRATRSAWSSLLRSILDSDWRLEPMTDDDLRRSADILDAYADSRVDFVDASDMAIAERLGTHRIYTLDRRDFSLVRPRHVDAFELLP